MVGLGVVVVEVVRGGSGWTLCFPAKVIGKHIMFVNIIDDQKLNSITLMQVLA